MIERFKELRSTFSIYDKHKNVIGALKKGDNWKPLTEQLMKFNHTLLWLLPVAKYVKKVYDIQGEIEDLPNDIIPLKVKDNLKEVEQEFDMYKSNNVAATSTCSGKVLAGHISSTATAQTIISTEVLRDPSSFGDIVRGLHVYGAKVLRPEALVSAFYTID